MSFIQVLFVFHAGTGHGFWTSSDHGISMAFAKKMMGFPPDLVSFSTKSQSKTYEKIMSHFLQGMNQIPICSLIITEKRPGILKKHSLCGIL